MYYFTIPSRIGAFICKNVCLFVQIVVFEYMYMIFILHAWCKQQQMLVVYAVVEVLVISDYNGGPIAGSARPFAASRLWHVMLSLNSAVDLASCAVRISVCCVAV